MYYYRLQTNWVFLAKKKKLIWSWTRDFSACSKVLTTTLPRSPDNMTPVPLSPVWEMPCLGSVSARNWDFGVPWSRRRRRKSPRRWATRALHQFLQTRSGSVGQDSGPPSCDYIQLVKKRYTQCCNRLLFNTLLHIAVTSPKQLRWKRSLVWGMLNSAIDTKHWNNERMYIPIFREFCNGYPWTPSFPVLLNMDLHNGGQGSNRAQKCKCSRIIYNIYYI
jgi:hypothetical protein